MSDSRLVALAQEGSEAAVRILIRRYNGRLFRVARSVTGDDAEAEDVVQEAYVKAFTHLSGFRGEAAFSTWLTRIALNEALGRLRRRRTAAEILGMEAAEDVDTVREPAFALPPPASPESEAARGQVRQFLERAVDELPDTFRMVFVLREIEGLSVKETAALLGIGAGTVKTRLHRARRLIRKSIERRLAPRFAELFPFGGMRCARIADNVALRLFGRQGRRAP
ncbi:MAG: RNA polymerase sigma factor [Alphaproteobacteria bacterium]